MAAPQKKNFKKAKQAILAGGFFFRSSGFRNLFFVFVSTNLVDVERERDFSSVPPVLRVHIIIVGILSSSTTASGRLDLALFSSLIRELAERKRVVARSGHVHVGVGHLSGTHVHIQGRSKLVPEPGKLPPS